MEQARNEKIVKKYSFERKLLKNPVKFFDKIISELLEVMKKGDYVEALINLNLPREEKEMVENCFKYYKGLKASELIFMKRFYEEKIRKRSFPALLFPPILALPFLFFSLFLVVFAFFLTIPLGFFLSKKVPKLLYSGRLKGINIMAKVLSCIKLVYE